MPLPVPVPIPVAVTASTKPLNKLKQSHLNPEEKITEIIVIDDDVVNEKDKNISQIDTKFTKNNNL